MSEPDAACLKWEIGVQLKYDHDTWEHYHPEAPTEEEARQKALDSAKSPGFDAIAGIGQPVEVYMVAGPWDENGDRVELADNGGECE